MTSRSVVFVALPSSDGTREGEDGWRVDVDGVTVIERTDDLDVGAVDFDALWAALGITVTFDFD